jgi:hypothetical protein
VIDATLLPTIMWYAVVDAENVDAKVPVLGTRALRVATEDLDRVTSTV